MAKTRQLKVLLLPFVMPAPVHPRPCCRPAGRPAKVGLKAKATSGHNCQMTLPCSWPLLCFFSFALKRSAATANCRRLEVGPPPLPIARCPLKVRALNVSTAKWQVEEAQHGSRSSRNRRSVQAICSAFVPIDRYRYNIFMHSLLKCYQNLTAG